MAFLSDEVVGVHLDGKVKGHVAAEISHEGAHSLGVDPTVWLGVEVLPGLLEVGGEVVVRLFALEGHVGTDDFSGGREGLRLLQDELTGWLSLISSELSGVLGDHRVHELVVARAGSLEVVWNDSLIVSKSFISLEIVLTSWEAWVRMILVPLSSDWVARLLRQLGVKLHVLWPYVLVLNIVVVSLRWGKGISDLVVSVVSFALDAFAGGELDALSLFDGDESEKSKVNGFH